MRLQLLSQGLHQDEAPTAHRLEADEMLKFPEAEGTPLVDLRHVHDVAYDAVRTRIGARPNRRRVGAVPRGKDSMAIAVSTPCRRSRKSVGVSPGLIASGRKPSRTNT